MMVVQEQVEVSAVVLVLVQALELVQEEDGVGCASVYCSCSFSKRNIAADEQLPCLLDVPLHFGNLHFGGAQERKGSVDTLCI
jgi:hypothetical protein